jgi:hypothetical protein
MELPFVSKKKYNEAVYKLECLLCHATGGLLSKHTYDLNTMERSVTDQFCKQYEEGLVDGYKNGAAEVAREIFKEIRELVKPITKVIYHGEVIYESPISLNEIEKKYTEGKT